MKLTASLIYPYDERIIQLFAAEKKEFLQGKYSIEHKGNELIFHVEALSSTGIRAAITTITKVLSVWETTHSNGTN